MQLQHWVGAPVEVAHVPAGAYAAAAVVDAGGAAGAAAAEVVEHADHVGALPVGPVTASPEAVCLALTLQTLQSAG